MRRFSLAIAAASVLAAVILPASASATEVQIGNTTTPLAAPVCPATGSCNIVAYRSSSYVTASDGIANPMLITEPGVISSMYVGVSQLSSDKATQQKDVQGLDSTPSASNVDTFGGPPEVALTVLRRVGTTSGNDPRWQVAAESTPQSVLNYLGGVWQFPLTQALPVVKGEIVALTVPTWAPILNIDQPDGFSYAQDRVGNAKQCGVNPSNLLELGLETVGNVNPFGCTFTKTREEYTATEITTPTPAASIRLAKRLTKLNRGDKPVRIR